ncbi:hypothetical protein PMAYCL1PPCAC_27713 [Pristionchus mayeri]|uniref:Uncharacterized protein n=1 Tax=Pristionchus mayeri TaxID=1317129 RepID=A0AAN5D6M5_9BILA|nr:hypothetical protein PMAYCL1PPCAC_27713 [Pristionchus mayeri]
MKLFLNANNRGPSLKAAQLLGIINRMCPGIKMAFEKFVLDSHEKFADVGTFIDNVSNKCDEPLMRNILEDFIDQPGRAVIVVMRDKDTVQMRQTRFLSTGFSDELRDERTRYTIPIFFTVNGTQSYTIFSKNESSISVQVPTNATFLIDNQYDSIYHTVYQDIERYANVDEELKQRLQLIHRKSLLVGLAHGILKFEEFVEHASIYVEDRIFGWSDVELLFTQASQILFISEERYKANTAGNVSAEVLDRFLSRYCSYLDIGDITNWDGLFNNDTSQFWEYNIRAGYTRISQGHELNMVAKISCLSEWHNSTTFLKFLGENFLGASTIIRAGLVRHLVQRTAQIGEQWPELHQFFFRNAHNFTDARWTNLADSVLSIDPHLSIADKYSEELHNFVRRRPRTAASMSDQIAMRLEREYVRNNLAKWHGVDEDKLNRARSRLVNRALDLALADH